MTVTDTAASRATASLGRPVSAAEFAARIDGASSDAPVTTSHAYVIGGLFTTVQDLADALRALRAARRTEDVVGLAIPLEGDDPADGVVRTRRGDAAAKRRFSLGEFLLTAIDPHRQREWTAGWAPGKNAGLAVELLGDLTRWLVGIQPMKIHDVPGGEEVWVLGRPNHAAAIQKVAGDSHEGYVGILATLGVPLDYAALCAQRLVAGDCLLTTCETDLGRTRSDARIMRRHGAAHVFDPYPLEWRYGVRQP